jgi:hypothetical protein
MKSWKKKMLALALCLTAILCLTACGGNNTPEQTPPPADTNTDAAEADANTDTAEPTNTDAEAQVETRVLQLGTSAFSITIPAHFVEGEITEEDKADDQVAYYYSDATLIDFDVYQFSKEGYADTLAAFVAEEAADNDASEVVTDAEINGIPVGYYRSVGESDGVEYDVITYAFEDNGEYLEIDFWLDGDTAQAEVDAIIQTLTK